MVTKPRQPGKSSLPSTTKPSSADLTKADPDAADSAIEPTLANAQPIPGADMVGRGIFIRPRQAYELKMVLFDRGQTPPSVYHCLANDTRYLVPRGCEVNSSPPMPPEQSLGETLIEESWDRFGKQVTFNSSAAAKTSFITIDPTALDASSFKTQEDAYYALRNAFVPFFTVYMPDSPSLPDGPSSPDGPSYLKALQKQIPTGPFNPSKREEYAAIFERFGTHYVKSAWVGGKASLVFIVSKSSELTEQEIRAGIQASIGGVATGTISTEEKGSLEKFRSNSSCRVFGSGGDKLKLARLSNLDKKTYDAWLDSVKTAPEVIQLGIAGIWTLLQNQAASQALKDAYLEETNFVPLTAIIPYGTALVFLDRDNYAFTYNRRPSDDESKIKERVTLGEYFPLLNKEDLDPELRKLRRFLRPHAAFSLHGFGPGMDDKMDDKIDMFEGNSCLRITVGATSKEHVAPDFPMPIEVAWPGVTFDRIDAAIAVAPNRVYFFRGVEYIRVDLSAEGKPYFVARDFITERWKGVTFERIDTAAYFGNSKVYFFSGDQYTRYDLAVCQADPGYPKFILSNYVEDWELFE